MSSFSFSQINTSRQSKEGVFIVITILLISVIFCHQERGQMIKCQLVTPFLGQSFVPQKEQDSRNKFRQFSIRFKIDFFIRGQPLVLDSLLKLFKKLFLLLDFSG